MQSQAKDTTPVSPCDKFKEEGNAFFKRTFESFPTY